MQNSKRTNPLMLLIGIFIFIVSNQCIAAESSKKVERKMLLKESIAHLGDQELTAVTVKLAPDMQVPAHQHDGFLYVYVLEGTIQSQLGNGEVITYQQGESWVEPPGVIHSLTRNPSAKYSAEILVVFIAKVDAELTTSGELSQPE